MVIVVGQAVHLGFFVLEVDEDRDDLGVDPEGVDEFGQFLFLAF